MRFQITPSHLPPINSIRTSSDYVGALRMRAILRQGARVVEETILPREPYPQPPVFNPLNVFVEVSAFADTMTPQQNRLSVDKVRFTEPLKNLFRQDWPMREEVAEQFSGQLSLLVDNFRLTVGDIVARICDEQLDLQL